MSATFATARSYTIQIFPLGDKRNILPGKRGGANKQKKPRKKEAHARLPGNQDA